MKLLKKIKKAVILTCAVCLAGLPLTVSAAGASLSAGSVDAEKGGTASVAVAINGNPGIWALNFSVNYDHSALTLNSVTNGGVFSDGDITPPPSLSNYVFSADSGKFENITANGTVVTLNFSVAANAEIKSYPITLSVNSAINIDADDVSISGGKGAVNVVKCIHNKVWTVTAAASCEKSGTETLTCTKCGETSDTRTINATGHKNTEIRNAADPTKKAEGYSGDTYCKDCGKLIEKGHTIAALKEDAKKTESKTSSTTASKTESITSSEDEVSSEDIVSEPDETTESGTDKQESRPAEKNTETKKGSAGRTIAIVSIVVIALGGAAAFFVYLKKEV